MAKLVKKLSLKQGDTSEEFYFDATTGVKGYDLYSTDETVVGKWKDGRPIYRKFFNIAITLTANTWYSPIANNFNGDLPIKVMFINETSKHVFNGGTDVQFYVDDKKVYFRAATNFGASGFFLDYIKTTDQPDSFEEEKVEITVEHKTGETYNGKPVYSKEISLTFGSADGRIADISSLNIDTIIDFTGYYRYTSNQLPVQFGYNNQCYVYFSPANSPTQMNAYALGTQSKNTTGKAIIRYTKK